MNLVKDKPSTQKKACSIIRMFLEERMQNNGACLVGGRAKPLFWGCDGGRLGLFRKINGQGDRR
jgi:hypothetical protein